MDREEVEKALPIVESTFKQQVELSRQLRVLGTPEELLRTAKGVGFYTRSWRTGDTHNWTHYLMLRLNPHAQKEIQDQAAQAAEFIKLHTPIVSEANIIYIMNGIRFSENEIKLLKRMLSEGRLNKDIDLNNLDLFKGVGFVIRADNNSQSKEYKLSREGQAFRSKLEKLLDA